MNEAWEMEKTPFNDLLMNFAERVLDNQCEPKCDNYTGESVTFYLFPGKKGHC